MKKFFSYFFYFLINILLLQNTYASHSEADTEGTTWIRKVHLGSINHSSNNQGGYVDFTAFKTNLVIGSVNLLTLTLDKSEAEQKVAYSVWIDYNRDGQFQKKEKVCAQVSKKSLVKAKFLVPFKTSLGSTKMRIATHEPHQGGEFQEIEEYTVNIVNNRRTSDLDYEQFTQTKLIVNPMPITDQTVLKAILPEEGNVTFSILNLGGEVVHKVQQNNVKGVVSTHVNLSHLASGIYHVEMVTSLGVNKVETITMK